MCIHQYSFWFSIWISHFARFFGETRGKKSHTRHSGPVFGIPILHISDAYIKGYMLIVKSFASQALIKHQFKKLQYKMVREFLNEFNFCVRNNKSKCILGCDSRLRIQRLRSIRNSFIRMDEYSVFWEERSQWKCSFELRFGGKSAWNLN